MSDKEREVFQSIAINFGVSLFFIIGAGFEWVLKDIFFSFLIAGLCFFTAAMDFVSAKIDKVHYFPAVVWIIIGVMIPIAAIWQGRLLEGRSPF